MYVGLFYIIGTEFHESILSSFNFLDMNLSYPTIKGRWFVCCFGTVRSPKWWQVVVYHTQMVHYNLCSMTRATLLLMNHNRRHKIIALFLYNYNTKFVENEQACNKSCNLTFPCPFAIWFLLFNKLKYYIAQKQQIPPFYHGPMHYQR
jgi:hypothetical protein